MLALGQGEGLLWKPAVGFARGCVLANPLSWCNLALGGKEYSACSFPLLQLFMPGQASAWLFCHRNDCFPWIVFQLAQFCAQLVDGANACVSTASAGQVTRVESGTSFVCARASCCHMEHSRHSLNVGLDLMRSELFALH